MLVEIVVTRIVVVKRLSPIEGQLGGKKVHLPPYYHDQDDK